MKELKAQAKVGVGIKLLWGALAKDICFALPRIIPNLVKEAQILEGDGGLGTVFLFKFGSGWSTYIPFPFQILHYVNLYLS